MSSTDTHPAVQANQDELEIWESQTDGRVSMEVDGEYGRPRRLTVKGRGNRLRITAKARRIVQESIRLEQNDPFRNGKLVRFDRRTEEARLAAEAAGESIPKQDPASENELTDEQLNTVFLLEGDDFEAAVKDLSEFNIRRLRTNAVAVDAKASQVAFLNDYIAENLTAQGDTPTYREIQEIPDSAL